MKTINLRALALALIFGCATVVAKDEPALKLKNSFNKVPVAEVPAKAAEIVAQTKKTEQNSIAREVVRMAVQKNPTIAVAVVGAVSHKSPDAAASAAATAAGIQPKQASLIARAAAAAAPAKAGAIVKAVCKAVPSAYREVSLAVAQVAPNSAREILEGLSEALPGLKGAIDQAVSSYSGQVLTIVAVLDRVPVSSTTVAAVTPSNPGRPPALAGPYVPLSGTPVNSPPGNPVPPGGRDYAAP